MRLSSSTCFSSVLQICWAFGELFPVQVETHNVVVLELGHAVLIGCRLAIPIDGLDGRIHQREVLQDLVAARGIEPGSILVPLRL